MDQDSPLREDQAQKSIPTASDTTHTNQTYKPTFNPTIATLFGIVPLVVVGVGLGVLGGADFASDPLSQIPGTLIIGSPTFYIWIGITAFAFIVLFVVTWQALRFYRALRTQKPIKQNWLIRKIFTKNNVSTYLAYVSASKTLLEDAQNTSVTQSTTHPPSSIHKKEVIMYLIIGGIIVLISIVVVIIMLFAKPLT